MKATDLDYTTDCPVCQTNDTDLSAYGGSCPACNDGQTINRYQDGPDGEIVIGYHPETAVVGGQQMTVVTVHTMPVRDEDAGGFEGRFGDWTPNDIDSGPMADYDQDTRDQLQNQPLGLNGPYDVNGNVVEEPPMPNGTWPSSADMALEEAIAWKDQRGDGHRRDELKQIRDEMDKEGVSY